MKIFLVITALIIAYVVFYALTLKSSITLRYKVVKVNIKNILSGTLGMTLDVFADNTSSNTIRINDAYFEIYYLNKLVAKTPKANNNIIIRSKEKDLLDLKNLSIELFLNKQSAAMLADYVSKKPLQLKVKLKAKILFIPVSILTSVVYNDYLTPAK